MKYAFIIGSNAFIIPRGAISYGEPGNQKDFLKINSIYHDTKAPAENSFLDIDLSIKDLDGSAVIITSNKSVTGAPYTVLKERDSVRVSRPDGSLIIHVHQLDDKAAMGLEHNITAELEINAPLAVVRVSGEFLVDSLHVRAENEKLFINDNIYATSAMTGHNRLEFTGDGVVI